MPRKKKDHQSELTPLEGEEAAGSGGGAPDASAPEASVPDASAIAMAADVTRAQLPSGDSPAPARAPSAVPNARAAPPPPDPSASPSAPGAGNVAVPVESESDANPPPPAPEEQLVALSRADVQAGSEAGVVSSAGEIDVLFLEKLAPEYECLHCRSVLRFPMKLKQCGHRVCSSCLQTFLECAASAF